ncbi:MAG: AAA family ATPase, partial [Spirochaetaceae bacterium]
GMKQAPLAVRFDTQLPAVNQIDTVINMNKQRQQVKYTLISLPLYLVERLDAIVSGYQT